MTEKNKFVQSLKHHDLGLKRGTVKLLPPSNKWAEAFVFVRDILQPVLPACDIQHTGSTAIPGCFAKPILDIVVWHAEDSTFKNETDALVKLGFKARGPYGIPGRHFFNFYDDVELDYIHIHAFPVGHANGTAIENFRDKLTHDPSLVAAYNAHKQALAASGISRKDYPDAKTDFVSKVLSEI